MSLDALEHAVESRTGDVPPRVSRCRACGGNTSGPLDSMCKPCWRALPRPAVALYRLCWQLEQATLVERGALQQFELVLIAGLKAKLLAAPTESSPAPSKAPDEGELASTAQRVKSKAAPARASATRKNGRRSTMVLGETGQRIYDALPAREADAIDAAALSTALGLGGTRVMVWLSANRGQFPWLGVVNDRPESRRGRFRYFRVAA